MSRQDSKPMRLADLCPIPLPAAADLPVEVCVGRGALAALPELAARHLAGEVLVLADPDTWAACGKGARLDLAELESRLWLLPTHPHADRETVDHVAARAGSCGGLLAVGAGTVNDLAKLAATELGLPYVVVGTAASMNGYASGIAAIFAGGGKTTVPARPPRAIVLDTEILAAAPAELGRAGFGDLLSKPVSDADWWLSSELDGGTYHDLPGRIVDAAVLSASGHAQGIRDGEPSAHEALARALVLSGVAMVVAGGSSPASGGEHLISHLWDMEALAAGRATMLHGAQVGVATCIAAALYQRVLAEPQPSIPAVPAWPEAQARIERELGGLARFALAQARTKHAGSERRAVVLRSRWDEIRAALVARRIPSPVALGRLLTSAGAPADLAALGYRREDAARALRCARDIRNRYTILDLAHELGVLPDAIDDVLDVAGV